MMLPYLEQQPLYNSCNFSWNIWYGTGEPINRTVFNMKVNGFLCPSDGQAGRDQINSYHGSFGTGGDPWATSTNGVFAPRFTSYGVADLTDGSLEHDLPRRGAGRRPDQRSASRSAA